MRKLSVVVTLLDEEDNVLPLITNIHNALNSEIYEIILVDDGSTDETLFRIKKLDDPKVKTVVLSKNYGQTAAIAAGLDMADGDYIITMDGDLQNDPSDIPLMLNTLEANGVDVVMGNRKNRKDGFLFRKVPSKLANMLIRKLTQVNVSDYGCTLKVFKKEIAKHLDLYGELHRFIPILAKLQGAKIVEVDVKHHPRIHGKTKYGLGRTFKVISDMLLMVFFQKYFRRPIHLFGPIGILSFLMGAGINIYLLIEKLMGNDIWGRPLLLLGVSLLLAGINFITFGLIAELIMRVYFESQSKKTYQIKELLIGKSNEKEFYKVAH